MQINSGGALDDSYLRLARQIELIFIYWPIPVYKMEIIQNFSEFMAGEFFGIPDKE